MATYSTLKLASPNPLLLRDPRTYSGSINFRTTGSSSPPSCAAVVCVRCNSFQKLKTFAMLKNNSNSNSSFSSTRSNNLLTALLLAPLKNINNPEAQSFIRRDHNYGTKIMNKCFVLVIAMVCMIARSRGRQSALAFTGGAMGGYSFSSSSSSSCSDWLPSDTSSSRSACCCYSSYDKEAISDSEAIAAAILAGITIYATAFWIVLNDLETKTNIIKLQVGLLVSGQSLRNDLNQIANTTNSSTEDGWKHMIQETINSLLQHDKYWISGSTSVVLMYNDKHNSAKKYFKKLSNKERKKFSEETLVNLHDMDKEHITSTTGNETNDQFQNTYMVVTILVAANRLIFDSHIPPILRSEDVKKALSELRHISNRSHIQGLHVLWTPQKANEVLSLKEVQENYPCLKAF